MPLSQRQTEYLALAWECFESEPKVDYDKFKSLAGLASANSARELLRVTKKKLKEEHGSLSGESQAANAGTANGTPKTAEKKNGTRSKTGAVTPWSRKRGRKAKSEMEEADGDGDDDEVVVVSPSKKAKVETMVEAEAKAEGEGEGEDDVFGDFAEFL